MKQPTLDLVRRRLADRAPRRAEPDRYLEAAVAVILAPGRGGALEMLFIKRARRQGDPWSGQMGLPGGRREPADEDLLVTARRETREETGIDLSLGWLLGELDDLEPVTPVLPPIMVRPFVFGLPARPGVRLSDEVELHVWTSFADLPASESETEVQVRSLNRVVPAYLLGPHVVWGMTHRIIRHFMELVD